MITAPENGRFSRTIVNRLWHRFFGRGIIESLDNMDGEPFDAELLDWLAADFIEQGYDVQHTIRLICTSRAYQSIAISSAVSPSQPEQFRGPYMRRMTAEQFVDAVSQITGVWQAETKQMTKVDSRGQGGQLAAIRGILKQRGAPDNDQLLLRAATVDADALQVALGRPNREQVVTRRESTPTPLEALEFTNGHTLDRMLRDGANRLVRDSLDSEEIVRAVYASALGRSPNATEFEVAMDLVGFPATLDGTQDFCWTILMLPEFQFID